MPEKPVNHKGRLRSKSSPPRVRKQDRTGTGNAAMPGLISAQVHGNSLRDTFAFFVAVSLAAPDCDETINPPCAPARVRTHSKEYVE